MRAVVLAALARVAPEIDTQAVEDHVPIRQQVDIDSMDFLNFLVEIHRVLGVDVPESDYREFETLDHTISYLVARADSVQPAPPGRT